MFTRATFARQALGLGLGLSLVGLLPMAAVGAEPQQEETAVAPAQSADSGIAIELGGVVVMRIRAGAAGYDPVERANLIYQRLTTALDVYRGRLAQAPVKVVQVKGDPTIFVGDVLIVTVDEETARINHMPASDLAKHWAQLLSDGIAKHAAINDPELAPPM